MNVQRPSPRTLIHRAARIIAGVAEEIRLSETVDGKWPIEATAWSLIDAMAKREHDDLQALATELRRYARTLPNREPARSHKAPAHRLLLAAHRNDRLDPRFRAPAGR